MKQDKLYIIEQSYLDKPIGLVRAGDNFKDVIAKIKEISGQNACPIMLIKENGSGSIDAKESDIIQQFLEDLEIPSIYMYSNIHSDKLEDAIDNLIIENGYTYKGSVILTFNSEDINESFEDFLLMSGPPSSSDKIGLYLIILLDGEANKNVGLSFYVKKIEQVISGIKN